MIVGVYADAHFTMSSSIVIGNTGTTMGRLDRLIKSFEWMYDLFSENSVELIINLGDLTDSPHLRAEEITAISKALSYRKGIPEVHILGNHETVTSDGQINSISMLNSDPLVNLVINPFQTPGGKFLYLPYGSYEEGDLDKYSADILFSHINIKESFINNSFSLRDGISPDYLSRKFSLVINGHIHTGSWVRRNILNIGSISGINFSTGNSSWNHSVGILDTETLDIKLFENPESLRFIKVSADSLGDLKSKIDQSDHPHNVIQVTVPHDLRTDTRKLLDDAGVIFSKIVSKFDTYKNMPSEYIKIDRVNTVEDGFKAMMTYFSTKEKFKGFGVRELKRFLKDALTNGGK